MQVMLHKSSQLSQIEQLHVQASVCAPVNNKLALFIELHFDLGRVSGVWCVRNAGPACVASQMRAGQKLVFQ